MAEIFQIFELVIWKIDDFINSFWLYLNFSIRGFFGWINIVSSVPARVSIIQRAPLNETTIVYRRCFPSASFMVGSWMPPPSQENTKTPIIVISYFWSFHAEKTLLQCVMDFSRCVIDNQGRKKSHNKIIYPVIRWDATLAKRILSSE